MGADRISHAHEAAQRHDRCLMASWPALKTPLARAFSVWRFAFGIAVADRISHAHEAAQRHDRCLMASWPALKRGSLLALQLLIAFPMPMRQPQRHDRCLMASWPALKTP